MKPLEQMWEEYKRTIPDSAGEVQVRVTRMAFYAGASSMFAKFCITDPKDAEDTARMLLPVKQEVADFLSETQTMIDSLGVKH